MALKWDIGKVDGTHHPNDDIVLATVNRRRADIARRGVLLLVCGVHPDHVGSRQTALLAADTLFNIFYDPTSRIVATGDALRAAFENAAQFAQLDTTWQSVLVPATTSDREPPPTPAQGANAQPEPASSRSDRVSMIAAAAHQWIVSIAHTGACCAFVWRKGRLSPVATEFRDPQGIGFTQHRLESGDTLLLVTDALLQAVGEQRVTKVLRQEKSTRRIVDALLGSAVQFESPNGVSVAVLRYDSPVARVILPVGLSLAVLVAVAALAMALFAGSDIRGGGMGMGEDGNSDSFAQWVQRLIPSFTFLAGDPTPIPTPSPTAASSAPSSPTSLPTLTSTPLPTLTPTATSTPTLNPSATARPTETPTRIATPTITPSVTPTPTRRPVRRNTATPTAVVEETQPNTQPPEQPPQPPPTSTISPDLPPRP